MPRYGRQDKKRTLSKIKKGLSAGQMDAIEPSGEESLVTLGMVEVLMKQPLPILLKSKIRFILIV